MYFLRSDIGHQALDNAVLYRFGRLAVQAPCALAKPIDTEQFAARVFCFRDAVRMEHDQVALLE